MAPAVKKRRISYSRKMNVDVEKGIANLPIEILSKIFAELPLKDRKETRRVCKKWFYANGDVEVSKDEKLLFIGSLMNGNFEMIENSQRKALNLEFVHVDFNDQPERLKEFWGKVGEKIKTLIFKNCTLSEDTIVNVVEFCENLRYFAIENPQSKYYPCQRNHTLMSDSTLEKLIATNMRRNGLRTLKLETYKDGWLSNDFVRVLLEIYPNVENFDYRCEHFVEIISATDYAPYEVYVKSKESSTFKNVVKKIVESRNYLKSIQISNCTNCQENELHNDLMQHHFPKLTSIGNIFIPANFEIPIFSFISRHSQLTSVEFRIQMKKNVEDKSFLECLMNTLLDSCTELQSLKVEISAYVCLADQSIFSKIKNSKLKILFLNFKLKVKAADGNVKRMINTNLESLHISVCGSKLNPKMIHAFIKTFQGLTELTIDGSGLSDRILQDIFVYQRKLTSLKLRRLEDGTTKSIKITDYGFTGIESDGRQTGQSISNLQNLKCLAISRRTSSMVTRAFFEQLKFPNLTSIFFGFNRPLPVDFKGEKLKEIFSNLPNLEAIVFVGDFEFYSWLDAMTVLKKLKFLYIRSYFPESHTKMFCNASFKNFFAKCPSLRALHRCKVVTKNPDEWKIYSFCRDVHEDIKRLDSSDERWIPPQIDDPNWVRFE